MWPMSRKANQVRGPNLQALHAEGRRDLCLVCDERLSPSVGRGRKRVICSALECRRVYMAAARRDHAIREARAAGRSLLRAYRELR